MNRGNKAENLLFSIVMLVLYLTILFNINLIDTHWAIILHIHPYVITLSPLIILIMVGSSIFRRLNLLSTILIWAGFFLITTLLFYDGAGIRRSILLALTDFIMLVLAVIISYWIMKNLAMYEQMLRTHPAYLYRLRVLEKEFAEPLIAAEIIRSRRYQYPVAVMAFGINRDLLHSMNLLDRLFRGGLIFARAWRIVANTLSSQARQSDLIIRDQDCFLVLCPEVAGTEQAAAFIDRIQNSVNEKHPITLLSGVSIFPQDKNSIEAAIGQAKQNMHIRRIN